jgi:hypothetical protein
MISKNIDVVVTSVLQTTAGKMIFGRYIEAPTAMPQPVAVQAAPRPAPAPVAVTPQPQQT